MKIGAQLYNVRNYCQTERDFRRSMKRIAEAGFGVVQLSGAGPFECLARGGEYVRSLGYATK